MDATTILLIFVSTCIVALWWTRLKKKRIGNLPPIPASYPVVGQVYYFWPGIHQGLDRIAKEHGPVVYLDRSGLLVLSSYEAINEAFVKQANIYSHRPIGFISKTFQTLDGEYCGIVNVEGNRWKSQRKFALTTLRKFGLGKNSIEEKIKEEAGALIHEIQQLKGQAMDPFFLLSFTTSNIINLMIFGYRHQYNDHEHQAFIKDVDEEFKSTKRLAFINAFPFVRYLPGDLLGFHEVRKKVEKTREYMRKNIRASMETYISGDSQCYIDVFTEEMKKVEGEGGEFCENQLLKSVEDFLLAGLETTTTTLRWGLLLVMLHDDIQRKIHEELDREIGSRQITMNDRNKLTYTEATILEIQRVACVTPFGIPHRTCEESQLMGYTIPANTRVISNFYTIFKDPSLWKDPQMFDPTRFLNETGNLIRFEHFKPFSIGPRYCIGESLAKMELFLIFTNLLQHFTFKIPEGSEPPSTKGISALVHAPEAFELEAHSRL